MEDGVTHNNLTINDVKVVAPLKHLSNFWKSLSIPRLLLVYKLCTNRQINKRG